MDSQDRSSPQQLAATISAGNWRWTGLRRAATAARGCSGSRDWFAVSCLGGRLSTPSSPNISSRIPLSLSLSLSLSLPDPSFSYQLLLGRDRKRDSHPTDVPVSLLLSRRSTATPVLGANVTAEFRNFSRRRVCCAPRSLAIILLPYCLTEYAVLVLHRSSTAKTK